MAPELNTSINLLFTPDSDGSAETVIKQIDRIRKAGFKRLDFNLGDWITIDNCPLCGESWREWIFKIKEHCDKIGVKFTQAHGPIYNILDCTNPRKEFFDKMSIRCAQAASLLGIKWIVYHAGSYDGPFGAHISKLKEENINWFLNLLKQLDNTDTGIAIENMADYFRVRQGQKGMYCSKVEHLIDLVDSFDSPKVGICWDTGHANIQAAEQGDCLRKIGKRLKTLHIQDNDALSDQHLAPFYGSIDWQEIMDALQDIGYNGDFTFEAHNFIRKVPDSCKDTAMRLLYEIGEYIVNMR